MDHKPSLRTLSLAFLKLGLTAFGGPAMVAYIKEMSVTRHKWLDEETFKDGVALCQMVPGATAMQTAAYVGLKSKGTAGALASFAGFGLPAFVLMLFLSIFYVTYHTVPWIVSLFNGLQVVVVAIVANATYSFGRATFKNYRDIFIALGASALYGAGISPFTVILSAALAGIVFLKNAGIVPAAAHERKNGRHAFRQLSMLLLIPCFGLLVLYFIDPGLFNLAALMMKIDLFAFGGGFASLPLMLHEIVNVRGWMDHKTFMDGIALGQVTPGPIVIASTFVGYITHGIAGAFVATIAIFTPSFLIVIAATTVFDRLRTSRHFLTATRGILASFVGLLFFVAVKFAFAVHWDAIRILLGVASSAALIKKVDILYIVLIGGAISVFVF